MGAKTWMIVYADSDARAALARRPELDREATGKLVADLFPRAKLEPLEDGDLSDTSPRGGDICIGVFPGVTVVAAEEFGGDYPSRLPARFIVAGGKGTVTLHAMHSVVDWFGYARWTDGNLVRALSLSPDSGILEDIGQRLPFEEPFWSGARPVEYDDEDEGPPDYPLPFHPLDLGEAALAALFGYHLEGPTDDALFEPETIRLARYKRRAWWRFW